MRVPIYDKYFFYLLTTVQSKILTKRIKRFYGARPRFLDVYLFYFIFILIQRIKRYC
jgi:hypothetical protein